MTKECLYKSIMLFICILLLMVPISPSIAGDIEPASNEQVSLIGVLLNKDVIVFWFLFFLNHLQKNAKNSQIHLSI